MKDDAPSDGIGLRIGQFVEDAGTLVADFTVRYRFEHRRWYRGKRSTVLDLEYQDSTDSTDWTDSAVGKCR